ncbi:MAG: helix-turn-helix transcriptional regulator [Oscillospiraceae bacterium]|nr:helix-turn-helix transcriptional regulator [Oscillospiraceae bacterium]
MKIGEATLLRVQQLCAERNITINKLATLSGVNRSVIGNWISRGIEEPSLSSIKKICDGLEMGIVEFFDCDLFQDLEQEIN